MHTPSQILYPRAESNCYLWFRKPLLYPLRYRGLRSIYTQLNLFPCSFNRFSYLLFRKHYIGISYLFTYQYFTEFPKNYLATIRQQMQKNGKITPPLHHKYSDISQISKTPDYIISRASYISSFLRSNSASVISECSSLSIARILLSIVVKFQVGAYRPHFVKH